MDPTHSVPERRDPLQRGQNFTTDSGNSGRLGSTGPTVTGVRDFGNGPVVKGRVRGISTGLVVRSIGKEVG